MILEGLHEKQIFEGDSQLRIASNYNENFSYPLHWHNATELVYSYEGECIVNVNKIQYQLNEKDILFISAGDIHDFNVYKNKGMKFFIQFDLSILNSLSKFNAAKSLLSKTIIIKAQEDKELHREIEYHLLKIISEYEKKAFAYDLFLSARILDIAVLLFRSLPVNKEAAYVTNRTHGLSRLDKAFEYIETNYRNDISLGDVANSAGFSEYHFSRIFKEATEKNFHSFLNEYRIKKAENLLADPDTTITQVAHLSGFNSIVTFNRIFRKLKGCSPTEYIKIHT